MYIFPDQCMSKHSCKYGYANKVSWPNIEVIKLSGSLLQVPVKTPYERVWSERVQLPKFFFCFICILPHRLESLVEILSIFAPDLPTLGQ